MLQHIPTHVICGALGAGKTSVLRNLMAQRPSTERWAVLINEFGDIGLDSALLDTGDAGVSLTEVAGGCVCCVNGVPFQVGLVQLLRKARPDRLFIEPSGLGHPLQLLDQLRDVPWLDVLAVQPAVVVVDAQRMTASEAVAQVDPQLLAQTGVLLVNKCDTGSAEHAKHWQAAFASVSVYCTRQGQLPYALLPGHEQRAGVPVEDRFGQQSAPVGAVWTDPQQPLCSVNTQGTAWSIGWRWHPTQHFELMRVQMWLNGMAWQRAKCVLHTNAGWLSGNAVAGQIIHWQNSEWRKDSRLELIFAQPQDAEQLSAELAACRVG
ncbi:GTP-binding protein [Denitrificimonas sp. JX-1]|uniref:GTP-binding protein n=1 Tax=Denitrificimonas halotolerans TaxID=3098930 RepID=A0ABU5GRA8_9GAMM|nr:GTP-binding protein [Denitrificimonas sp. JX-1]MDY7219374.1 GTP-binding protein [Denitrificimonas sp. JX-1]